MTYINIIAAVSVMIFICGVYAIKKNITKQYVLMEEIDLEENNIFSKYNKWTLFFLFCVGILIRIACAIFFEGHPDIDCFKYWGDLVYNDGFGAYYESEGLADYLPGYIYILRLVSALRYLLDIHYDTVAATFLFKMPAMICDIILAYIIYKIAKKRFANNNSTIIMAMFLFNPIVILNSSVWGQIDSMLTVFLVLMCYLVYTDNMKFAYIVYGIGFLVKPQMVMFTPVLLLAFIEKIFVGEKEDGKYGFRFNSDELFMQGSYCIISIAVTILACVPFGLVNVFNQCFNTMGSYEYAAVNAYNFWGMLGLNWCSQDDYLFFLTYKQWGLVVIFALVVISVLIWLNNFKERSRYIIMGAFLGIGMFTLSVRMHERYIFPAIILLLVLFIVTKRINSLWLYAGFSIVSFYNTAHVLFYYDPYNFDREAAPIIITSFMTCVLFVFLSIYLYKNYIKKKYKFETYSDLFIKDDDGASEFKVMESEEKVKITKNDLLIMLGITIVYAVVAFYNLGDKVAPESEWSTNNYDEEIIIEIPDGEYVKSIDYFLGNYENREFYVYTSDDGEEWRILEKITMVSVFCWEEIVIDRDCKYIKLVSGLDKAVIKELVVRNENDEIITPLNAEDESLKGLFDEQETAVDEFNYRNSTIFDEIYHARSAYEFNNGLYCYEWTHPPLGKFFISLGMKAFGDNPFGWRFAGTLFGVLMLPFMYVFGKKMFKTTFFATLTCTLMACDFMHFAQTRIATIDVFVTFFVILMYLFMYMYYKMSFYDTKLYKTLIPLFFCGVSMGLGCASKWTGVYAGIGLGVIFFYTIYLRYREYLHEKKHNMDSYIVKNYYKNLWITGAACVVFFIIIPAVIYTLSYIPFVGGEDAPTSLIGKMLHNQEMMFNYHKDCIFEHPYSSRWYEWALMIRPILYYSGVTPDGKLERISSFGNPFIWWFGIIAFIYLLYLIKKDKDKKALFLVIAYLAQMIPWTPVARTTFIYHYFTSVPFVILMNVYCMYKICENRPDKSKHKPAIIYMAVVIGAFIMFYPCLSGMPMPEFYDYNILRWLASWYV